MSAEMRELEGLDKAGEISAGILVATAGSLSLGLAPLIVQTLITEAGLTASEAGRSVSGEMAGAVVGTVAVLTIGHRLFPRTICAIALGIIILGNVLCYVADGWLAYAAARTVAGLGCGLTAVAYGLLARTRQPARNFAILSLVAIPSAALSGFFASAIQDKGGPPTLFAVISAVAVIALATTALCMPRGAKETGRATNSLFSSALQWKVRLRPWLGILVILFYFIPVGAFWAYAAQIAQLRGQAPSAVDVAISGGFLVAGVAGSFLAAWLARRPVTRAVVTTCLFMSTAAIWSICYTSASTNPLLFFLTLAAFLLAWFVVYPFLMGILAQLDPLGWLATAGVLAQTIAFVVGPLLTGPLIAANALGLFAIACSVSIAVAWGCALWVIDPNSERRLPRLEYR